MPHRRRLAAEITRPVPRLERALALLVGALLLMLALVLAPPAQAKLAASGPDGFVSTSEAVVHQPPASVWPALLGWSAWWDPAHSYSGKPGAMRLEAAAGGLLFEQWPGGDVVHARVVNVMQPSLLRLEGGFGPLQALPVNAVMSAGFARLVNFATTGKP